MELEERIGSSLKAYYEETSETEENSSTKNNQSNAYDREYNLPPRVESKYQEKLHNKLENVVSAKNVGVDDYSLSLSLTSENDKGLSFGAVHKLWAMVTLRSKKASLGFGTSNSSRATSISVDNSSSTQKNIVNSSQASPSKIPIDFVIVIDHSSSMKLSSKLAYVQATIEYLIGELQEWHRFCLIQFNQDSEVLTPLVEMTSENKKHVLRQLHTIRAEGSTNLSQPLFLAISQLTSRRLEERGRVSSVMIFTDGLANTGLKGNRLLKQLLEMKIPSGLTIHTFGYGADHDSATLQNIAFASRGGVYHYIETPKNIASTFGECLAGIMSTTAHNIELRVQGADGCRIINFYTKFPVETKEDVKDYVVSMGSMYSDETKSILMKLSLRKMSKPMAKHQLVKVTVNYTNSITNRHQMLESWLEISRPEQTPLQPVPVELDRHINRFTAATAIEDSIKKAMEQQYAAAQEQLQRTIDTIQQSVSAKDGSTANYCEDLIADLKECAEGMENPQIFSQAGIHYAHSYAAMYFLERSTGSWNLRGIKVVLREQLSQQSNVSSTSPYSDGPNNKRRHAGYGYLTEQQELSAKKATHQATHYVSGYLEEALQDI